MRLLQIGITYESGTVELECLWDVQFFRTRLIGLAALSAAVQTDLLFASRSDFSQQAKVVIPALMQNLWLGDLDESKLE